MTPPVHPSGHETGWTECGKVSQADLHAIALRVLQPVGLLDHLPKAVSSTAAASQAFASRDEIYTLAPLVTKPSEIIRPMPFAPPVTSTTLPCDHGKIVTSVSYQVLQACGV